ncbi:VOC family protein [uncultured Nocardioides sp.]|uniref:VOC family protein n=1 Tax=uncultured Nocardioides sp. TaxID=198441 RepID=UPI00262DF0B9|nr:VOC family protein [uncultured Nocardioides sp.]
MTTTELKMITLDCADVRAEAAFWAGLLGWDVAVVEDEYAMLTRAGAPALGLGRVEDHEPPAWPNPRGTKQFHLDLGCEDMAASEARAVELGGSVPDEQPGETWRVLLSPAGHPFCLTDAANW